MPLETPRDRNGTFEPKIVGKGQTRLTGFDDKIISMYARGMSTREITGHLEEIYGVELSPALISNVTEEVMEEVKTWQGRPLDARRTLPPVGSDGVRVFLEAPEVLLILLPGDVAGMHHPGHSPALHWRQDAQSMGGRGRKWILSQWNYEAEFEPVLSVLRSEL